MINLSIEKDISKGSVPGGPLPNLANVGAPITLVGYGRSGTSLLQSVFDNHPLFEAAGETTELIFGSYMAAEAARDTIRWQLDGQGKEVAHDLRCGEAVRGALVGALPSNKPRWMQKPIGLPGLRPYPKEYDPAAGERQPCPADWYWRVLNNTFPQGRFFTILRQPCDVVLSSADFWGWKQPDVWTMLAEHAAIMMHPTARLEYAISFDDLLRDTEGELRKLFTRFDVPWHDDVMKAKAVMHVPAPGRTTLSPQQVSRRDQWHRLDPTAAQPWATEIVVAYWKRFGLMFDLPPQFPKFNV